MSKIRNLTGQKFGKLTVCNEYLRKKGQTYWLCKCECGNTKYVALSNLSSNKITSCSKCLTKEISLNFTPKRLFNIFAHMKQRCYNPKSCNYNNYGGRGIKICDEWLNDSKKFYAWAKENGYKDNLTIDRINVNGNYEPANCRWLTLKEQQNNRTNNRKITINNVTKTASQWAEYYNITHEGFMWRYRNGKI